VRAYLEANAEPLRLMRHARGLRRVDWGTRYASPMINTLFRRLPANRGLSKLARTAVVFHHQTGDHSEAVETLLDIHALATKLCPRGDASIICHLVAIAIDAVAVDALEYVTPTLGVADAKSLTEVPSRLATHSQISMLIRTLTNEDAIQASAREGFYAERAMSLDSATLFCQGKFRTMATGGPGNILAISPFRPAFVLDTARMMRMTTRNAEALVEPNWPAARLKMVKDDGSGAKNSIGGATRMMSSLFMPSLERVRWRCGGWRRWRWRFGCTIWIMDDALDFWKTWFRTTLTRCRRIRSQPMGGTSDTCPTSRHRSCTASTPTDWMTAVNTR